MDVIVQQAELSAEFKVRLQQCALASDDVTITSSGRGWRQCGPVCNLFQTGSQVLQGQQSYIIL